MFENMHIISETPIKDFTTTSDIVTAIGITILILTIIFYARRLSHTEDAKTKDFKITLLGTIIGAIVAISSVLHIKPMYAETGKYRYVCTLDDNISANELTKHFNIISVKDNTWTLEDK